ncbi:MAG: hypothetical protein AAF182_01815 [Pseudomonadota bacterium]
MSEDEYNWENYIELDIQNTDFKAEMTRAIAHMANTQEGRDIIEKAFELNKYKKITVEDKGDEFFADYYEGTIRCPESLLNKTYYYDAEGNTHPLTAHRFVFHELFHFADEERHPDVASIKDLKRDQKETKENRKEAYINFAKNIIDSDEDITLKEARKIFNKHASDEQIEQMDIELDSLYPHENRAIAATNAYMKKYFDKSERYSHAAYVDEENLLDRGNKRRYEIFPDEIRIAGGEQPEIKTPAPPSFEN